MGKWAKGNAKQFGEHALTCIVFFILYGWIGGIQNKELDREVLLSTKAPTDSPNLASSLLAVLYDRFTAL